MRATLFVSVVMAIASTSCTRSKDSQPRNDSLHNGTVSQDRHDQLSQDRHERPEEMPAVILEPSSGETHEVKVEVVRTRRAIRRGLMFRQHLAPDHGMLFLMEREEVHSFWMRNTFIPLDMIFIRKDMTVAGVVANAKPQSEEGRRVDEPSLYVLEVNAGWAAKHKVGKDTRVRFEGVR